MFAIWWMSRKKWWCPRDGWFWYSGQWILSPLIWELSRMIDCLSGRMWVGQTSRRHSFTPPCQNVELTRWFGQLTYNSWKWSKIPEDDVFADEFPAQLIMIVRVHNTSSLNSGYRSWKSGMGNQRLAMETSNWPFWIRKGVLTPKPCFQNRESSSSLFHVKPWNQLQMLNFRDRRDRWCLFPLKKKYDFCTLILPGTKVGCTVGRETSLRTKGVAFFQQFSEGGFVGESCRQNLPKKTTLPLGYVKRI